MDGLDRPRLYSEDFTDFFKTVACDGDAAVDGRVKLKIVTAGAAWSEGADAI